VCALKPRPIEAGAFDADGVLDLRRVSSLLNLG
jgi:hypothetical protein